MPYNEPPNYFAFIYLLAGFLCFAFFLYAFLRPSREDDPDGQFEEIDSQIFLMSFGTALVLGLFWPLIPLAYAFGLIFEARSQKERRR